MGWSDEESGLEAAGEGSPWDSKELRRGLSNNSQQVFNRDHSVHYKCILVNTHFLEISKKEKEKKKVLGSAPPIGRAVSERRVLFNYANPSHTHSLASMLHGGAGDLIDVVR